MIDVYNSWILPFLFCIIPYGNFDNDADLQNQIFDIMKQNAKNFNLSCSIY